MNRNSLLWLYDRLTGLVEKLPGGLQKPILRELVPIRTLFLETRPARIFLVGGGQQSIPQVFSGMGAEELEAGKSKGAWRTFSVARRGTVEVLDGRLDAQGEHVEEGIASALPDLIIFLEERETTGNEWKQVVARIKSMPISIIGITRASAFRLQARLAGESHISHHIVGVFEMNDPACVEAICAALPLQAQLEFARLTNAKRAQAHIARSLLKSFSAVCGVIGVQPIPLADLPILTALQTLMVGMIIYTTGRLFNVRTTTEFLGALGLNIGAGLVLREGARALVRVVPIWGNAVSGLVAGAGTYAIGRAAIAYFIEDTPIQETRKIFRNFLPRFGKKSRPPELPDL